MTERSIGQLKKLAEDGALAHGYVFFGTDKRQLNLAASSFVYFLEGKKDNETLVDVIWLDNENGKAIGIDEVRKVKRFLWQHPLTSRKKTAVIGGDLLTPQAQNSLLKISEDSPAHALIIVLVQNQERLLPTLNSRFQKIYFPTSSESFLPDKATAGLALKFIRASRYDGSKIIKTLLEQEDERGAELADSFLNCLIDELKNDVPGNFGLLKAILERQRLFQQYPLNKRLQLEFLNDLWHN